VRLGYSACALQPLYDVYHIKPARPERKSHDRRIRSRHRAVPPEPAALSESPQAADLRDHGVRQFMALLDIQIVAGLAELDPGGLNAGPDEIAWVQTAYLMAEIVMIPLAAFLSQALSTRWLFTLSAGLFPLSSLMCGLAWDINSMIAFRALQGFTGGAMVPLVFATGFAMFEGPRRAMIPAILGIVSTLAPTLGPTIGGMITENFDWRWLFYMNIVPGVAVDHPVPAAWQGGLGQPGHAAAGSIGCTWPRWRCSWVGCSTCWRRARATSGSADPAVADRRLALGRRARWCSSSGRSSRRCRC
jgi:MFS family permease